MPEVRIAKCCIVLVFGEEPYEIQPDALGQRAEYCRGHKDDIVSSLEKGQRQPDVGMNVASAA
jgi:hypothetical protein